jgi:hypothetical protein
MRCSQNGKIPGFDNKLFVNYLNILCLSHQIDNWQLPAPDACGVKRRQGAILMRAISPEPAR